jgi:hypothetical protein
VDARVEQEVGMDVIVERAAALDVHKEQVTACVRVTDEHGARVSRLAEFKTTVRGLLVLHDWLTAHRVTQITMEATGVYWKPVWYVLEDEFELLLVNARHVKQVPGRKTDVSDAAWLCQLAEAGLLRASFVPPKPIRALRQLTRYRKAQIGERQREANRLHKALEDTSIKLDCVEPPRLSWRSDPLRRMDRYGETTAVSARGSGAGHEDGVRAPSRVRVAVGSDHVDRREVRDDGRDAQGLGQAGRGRRRQAARNYDGRG